MRLSTSQVAGAAAVALASQVSAATYLGFNSGSTLTDKSAKVKADWLKEFNTAQNLKGAPGTFNAVRLYTNIQANTDTDPIEAFEAAIETKTKILLGVWASGTTSIDKELAALKTAIDKHGKDLADLVVGMSIGSEDLYRNSVTGVTNKAGVGADPDVIVGFIGDYKKAFNGTLLADTPIGHVDTWDVWGNSSNKAVLDAVDWIGVDEYPYYETGKNNTIENAPGLFDAAYKAVYDAVGGKEIWVTETGWPYTGPDWDLGVPSVDNAKYYWDEVGCRNLFNKVNTFWYTLRDSNPDNKMKFAITSNLSTTPMFNLTCPTTFKTPSLNLNGTSSTTTTAASTASATASSTGSGSSATSTSSGKDNSAAAAGLSSAALAGAVVLAGAAQLLF